MIFKFIFLASLFASAVIAAKLPSGLMVNRNQPVANQDVVLGHEGVAGIQDSNLQIVCAEDGGVSLTLVATNPTKAATIAVSATEDAVATPECISPVFTFPLAADTSAVFPLTSDQSVTCGRTLVPADSTNGARFTWWVVVKESVQINPVSVRSFSSNLLVTCQPALADSKAPEFDQNPETPVNEGQASFTQAIGFNLVKSEELEAKKWQFTLTPNNPSSLLGTNFRLVECKASPADDESVQADLIVNSCISDPGTTVNSTGSPAQQVIAVHPFQFSDFPLSKVLLSCSVELCSDEAGSNCGQIAACVLPPPVVEESPVAKRSRRSLHQMYYTSTV